MKFLPSLFILLTLHQTQVAMTKDNRTISDSAKVDNGDV